MKNINPLGLFDDHFLMEKLTKLGNPLQKLNDFIDWNIFKSPLVKAFDDDKQDQSKGGRPPFDKLMMFKALIVQGLYNLSDDQLEYQIVDRASFKRFLEIKKSDKVPDSKTFGHLENDSLKRMLLKTCLEHSMNYLIRLVFLLTRENGRCQFCGSTTSTQYQRGKQTHKANRRSP